MKSVLISGGSSGIGLATARHFVHKGFRVYELSRSGVSQEGVIHISGDVTRPEDCLAAVKQVIEQTGSIDVLICNAGMGVSGAVEFSTAEAMHRQMEVNFFGVVNLIQAVLPSMRERRCGRILVVSSVASLFSIPFQSFYSASKSAVNAVVSALRNEMSPYGIQIGMLLPGDVKTGFTSSRSKSTVGDDVYPRMHKAVSTMERDEEHGQSSERIARCLYVLATRRCLTLYNYEGIGYRLLVLLARFLPNTLVNWVVGKLY